MKKIFLFILLSAVGCGNTGQSFDANSARFSSVYGPGGYNACDFDNPTPVVGSMNVVDPLAAKVKDILVKNGCVDCHGAGKTGGAGIFKDIEDHDEWIRNSFVNLSDPPTSRAYKSVTRATNPMPLGRPPLSLVDRGAILDWIKAGAPSWEEEEDPPPAQGNFVGYYHEVACIAQDLERIDDPAQGGKVGDGKNFQYFTLSNIYNQNVPGRFENLKWALDNALNYTTFTSAAIFNSEPVDNKGVVRRIDLRKFHRKAEEFDNLLLPVYPYAIDYSKGTYFDRATVEDILEYEDEIKRLTGRERPYIRADFFVDRVMGPDFYYDFLLGPVGLDFRKNTIFDVERLIGVDANTAVANFEADASVIRKSGVSLFNRVIHRYDARYSLGGTFTSTSYWKTFDVINEIAERNFFAFPLGPEGVKFNFTTQKVFEFDAGEAFVQMPNGLQAFFVADSKGKLLTEAVTTIVVDRSNVDPFQGTVPYAVTIGAGCLSCHAGGVNAFQDQLRYHAAHTSGFNNNEINAIKQLFPDQGIWDASFKSYNASFQTAHERVIANPVSRASGSEPTVAATRKYLGELSVEETAGEFGVPVEDFKLCLYHAADLAQALGLSEAGLGRVTRDALDDNFDEVVEECAFGEQVLFKAKGGGVKPPPIKPPPKKKDCKFSIKNNDSLQLIIEPKGDSSKRVSIQPGGTRSGTGEIDISYWVGRRVNKFFDFHLGCRDYSYAVVGGETDARGEFR